MDIVFNRNVLVSDMNIPYLSCLCFRSFICIPALLHWVLVNGVQLVEHIVSLSVLQVDVRFCMECLPQIDNKLYTCMSDF